MDSYKSELNKISVQKKSDYLELIKQYRKNIDMRKSFDITLHKSLKLFNEKKNNPNEKEIQNQDEKKEKMIIKNLEENILTPPKKIKKHIIKTSPKKRQGAKIIYKNSTNLIKKLKECPSENIEKEKLNQKENVNKNILNNDKDASTTSTTSPITTPIKGIKDSNSDNFSTIFFSGDNHKRSYYHYEKNKKKYNETFNIINDTINTTTFDKFNETEYQDNTLDNNYFNNTIQIPEYLPKKIVINKRLVDKTQTNGKYYNYYQNQNLNKNNSNKYDLSLNIEDLIMIEDKFSKLIKTVNDHNINIVNKTCYEWWNYYFNCSLKGNCDYLFSEPRNKNVIACYNSLLLISIMLIYDLSFQPKLFLKLIDFLKNVLFINHQNYLNICQYLMNKTRIFIFKMG